MAISAHDALIYLMVVTASSDATLTEQELQRIRRWSAGCRCSRATTASGSPRSPTHCADLINGSAGLDGVLDMAIAAIPQRLQDTAYALAVEVAAVDLRLEQEELRFLEMIRDRLDLDRLITAAIETAARARHRRARCRSARR